MSHNVRTYGISVETSQKLMRRVFDDFYRKVKIRENDDEMAGLLVDMLEGYTAQAKALILATAVFAIGNFDRIDKVEMWADVTENGMIDNSTLKELSLGFIS